MDGMQEAMLKAGLISQEKIDREKEAEEQAEREEQKRVEEAQRQAREEQQREAEIRNAALKLFNDLYFGKGRGFLNHVVHSFLAMDKKNEVDIPVDWSFTKVKSHKCCICNVDTISIMGALDLNRKAFDSACEKASARRDLNSDKIRGRLLRLGVGEIDEEQVEGDFNQFMTDIREGFQGKKLAVCSKNSTAVLCYPCYQVLYEWIFDRLMNMDRSIQRIVAEHNDNPLAQYYLRKSKRR